MLKTLANYGCCLLFVATGCASTSEDNLSDAATCDSAAEDCPAQSALDAAADDAQEESTANTGGTASAASDTEDTDDADSSVNCTEDRRRARIGDCDDTTNQTVLYENDFETPAAPVAATCGTVLHQGNLTELYGNGLSSQEDVSVVLLHVLEPQRSRNAAATSYALGMPGDTDNGQLALSLSGVTAPALSVSVSLSSATISDCGGPFSAAAQPTLNVTVLDTPCDDFRWDGNYNTLATASIQMQATDSATLRSGAETVTAFDISAGSSTCPTLRFAMKGDGYGVLDDLIVSTTDA